MRVQLQAGSLMHPHGAYTFFPHTERRRAGETIGTQGHQDSSLLIRFERHASTVQQKIAAWTMSHRNALLCQQAQVIAAYLHSMRQKWPGCEYPEPLKEKNGVASGGEVHLHNSAEQGKKETAYQP